jgi:hypothetical protein
MGRSRNAHRNRYPGQGYLNLDSPYQGGGMPAMYQRPVSSLAGQSTWLPDSRFRPNPALAGLQSLSLKNQMAAASALGISSKLLKGTDYLGWQPKETGEFQGTALNPDATVLYEPVVTALKPGGQGDEAPKRTLEELVNNHLTARRQTYTSQGWTAFQSGDYRGALRLFSLAENASLDKPEDRAYLKLVTVYAAIAAREYSTAADALIWLTATDSDGRPKYASAFNRIFDDNGVVSVAQLYATPEERQSRESTWVDPDFLQHVAEVESIAARTKTPESPESRALLAVMEWGRGRRGNALFEAGKLVSSGSPVAKLSGVMQAAEALRSAKSLNAGSAQAPNSGVASPVTGSQPSF